MALRQNQSTRWSHVATGEVWVRWESFLSGTRDAVTAVRGGCGSHRGRHQLRRSHGEWAVSGTVPSLEGSEVTAHEGLCKQAGSEKSEVEVSQSRDSDVSQSKSWKHSLICNLGLKKESV